MRVDKNVVKPVAYGTLAGVILLSWYFTALTFVSGWNFALRQFSQYWYFIVALTFGFGIQIGLYTHLRSLITSDHHGKGLLSRNATEGQGKVVGVTGATTTVAMVSCCTHYLANLFPILGTIGVVTFVAQYQAELFLVGLLFNFGGIFYIANNVAKFSAEHGSACGGKQTI